VKLEMNCWVAPTFSDIADGVTVTAWTVTSPEPEFAPDVAVTVQDSAVVVALKNPLLETEPVQPELTVHVGDDADVVNCCVPATGIVAVVGDTVTIVAEPGNVGLSGPSAALIVV
jgi:hypothetical protein